MLYEVITGGKLLRGVAGGASLFRNDHEGYGGPGIRRLADFVLPVAVGAAGSVRDSPPEGFPVHAFAEGQEHSEMAFPAGAGA